MLDKLDSLASNAKKNLEINPDEAGNAEIEKNEVIFNKTGLFTVQGKNAKSHKAGGVPTTLEKGDFVFSDKVNVKGKEVKSMFPWLSENKTYSMADISSSGPLKNFNNHLDKLGTPYKIDAKTAEMMTGNILNKLSALSLIQETIKGLPNGVPDLAQIYLGGLENKTGEVQNQPGENSGKFAFGGEPTTKRKIKVDNIPQSLSIFDKGFYQYQGRDFIDELNNGTLNIDGVNPYLPLKTQSKTKDGNFGGITEDTKRIQLNKLNAARSYTGNSLYSPEDPGTFQRTYNTAFFAKTGKNYFDDNSTGPYSIDSKWGKYSASTPTWGLNMKGKKAGRVSFQDLVDGKMSEDQLMSDYGKTKEDIIKEYNASGAVNAGISYIDFTEGEVQTGRAPVEMLSNPASFSSPVGTPAMPTIQPDMIPRTASKAATEYETGQVNDTGYNMMENLNALMAASALTPPNIYPKRYENFGIPQAMGLVQNESPLDLEAQREGVRQAASTATNANNALSTTSAQAAINNTQVAANSANALNQISGQEYNGNVQRQDRKNEVLQNLILNRGADLMGNARQYNSEMDAVRQNIYEERMGALRGLNGTLAQNYNNKLQRNLINSMYGDNMQLDAEGRTRKVKSTNMEDAIAAASKSPTKTQAEQLAELRALAETDPKLMQIYMQQWAKATLNPKQPK